MKIKDISKYKKQILWGIAFIVIPGSTFLLAGYYGFKRFTKRSEEDVQTTRSKKWPVSNT